MAERRGGRAPQPLALVSVKSVYGHTEGAAGVSPPALKMCLSKLQALFQTLLSIC